MSNPNRDWITENIQLSLQYKIGVNEFIRLASKLPNENGHYRCPCKSCNNVRCLDIGVVKNHLLNKGFTPGYTEWYHHGERRMIEAASETNQRGVGGLHDALLSAEEILLSISFIRKKNRNSFFSFFVKNLYF